MFTDMPFAGRGVASAPLSAGGLPKERTSQLLRSLERFYGITGLADNKEQLHVPFRSAAADFCKLSSAWSLLQTAVGTLPQQLLCAHKHLFFYQLHSTACFQHATHPANIH
jgi:hypothetical protein